MNETEGFVYPTEFLNKNYIQPCRMKKFEAALLLEIPWYTIKHAIQTDDQLRRTLERYGYKSSQKYLSQLQVAVLFAHYGAPVASDRSMAIEDGIWQRTDESLHAEWDRANGKFGDHFTKRGLL